MTIPTCLISALLGVLFAMIGASCCAIALEPLRVIQQTAPGLYKLHQAYPSHHEALANYAKRQGFHRPVETLATVIHEIIHIDSAAHQGYYVNGIYYEPYLNPQAWPILSNEQVLQHIQDKERSSITRFYAINTPMNHLGNLLDEINAYTHVLPLTCKYEPESAERQINNLSGFLNLTEVYLRTLRTKIPEEYRRLGRHTEARGAFSLISQRARKALEDCQIQGTAIASQESTIFLLKPPERHP